MTPPERTQGTARGRWKNGTQLPSRLDLVWATQAEALDGTTFEVQYVDVAGLAAALRQGVSLGNVEERGSDLDARVGLPSWRPPNPTQRWLGEECADEEYYDCWGALQEFDSNGWVQYAGAARDPRVVILPQDLTERQQGVVKLAVNQHSDAPNVASGGGSGFIVRSGRDARADSPWVLTAGHVVDDVGRGVEACTHGAMQFTDALGATEYPQCRWASAATGHVHIHPLFFAIAAYYEELARFKGHDEPLDWKDYQADVALVHFSEPFHQTLPMRINVADEGWVVSIQHKHLGYPAVQSPNSHALVRTCHLTGEERASTSFQSERPAEAITQRRAGSPAFLARTVGGGTCIVPAAP